MHGKFVFMAAAIVMAGVAGCSSAEQFYVAQNASDKKCQVTNVKPDGTTMVMIGAGSYKTRAEAETAMSAAPECQAPAAGG